MDKINNFRFWCQKVLPIVYDNSLSYYEVLCKVRDYLNKLIDTVNGHSEMLESLQSAVSTIEEALENLKAGNYSALIEIIQNAIKNVWFGITDDGYFVAYVPEAWSDITFKTTGYDIDVPICPEYGHLVLQYN